MTYEQLNIYANQIAHELIKKGVAYGDKVAILMDPSIDIVASIFAVLKSGAAYVPINPDYPEKMQNEIITGSDSKVLLTNSKSKATAYTHIKTILVDSVINTNIGNPGFSFPQNALAYVIYTSGTTGYPKGVEIEHRNVISLLEAANYGFIPSDVWTLFHLINFDFSVWEIFGSLLTGASLVVIPDEIRRNVREFRKILIENEVTILNITPSAFYSLQLEELKHLNSQLFIKRIIFGGESLAPIRLKEWKNKYPSTVFINMYGITETTVHVTYKELSECDIYSDINNIGQALTHLKIYLLNESLTPVLEGDVGEIFVEGAGLARGYLNNPALTEEKFFVCPGVSKNRLYRSGDLAQRLPSGDLAYLGRIDNQVKVRGHRIELEAIEKHLNQFDGIIQSIVIAHEISETDKILKAFYTSKSDIRFKDIANYLGAKLPSYMIPSVFVCVDGFPLTSSGKIDRKKVLEHETANYLQCSVDNEMSLTQQKIFSTITGCFSEENLNNSPVSANLDITHLDSLNFIRVVVALEEEFGFEFDDEMMIVDSFSTIHSMIEYVESKISILAK